MSDDFAQTVRDARLKMGWDQAELGRRVGVGQQAVSNWESGRTQPRPAVAAELKGVLGLPATKSTSHADARPVRPLTTVLPFHDLSSERFEEFVADLAHLLHPHATVSRYGGQGHEQDGIDVVAVVDDSIEATFQCKRHRQFGPQKVADAVAAFKLECRSNYLVLSRPSASPDARKEIAKHAGWVLWDAEDLSRLVRYDLMNDQAIRIVDTYFPGPGWREHFLGIAEPGAWLSVEEAFRPAVAGSLYSHDWQLVGRSQELADVVAFMQSGSSKSVGLLVGRGGIGKTRFLRAIAEEAARYDIKVRLLGAGAELTSTTIDLLPRDRPLLVLIDDAHTRTDTQTIVQQVLLHRPQAKVLISLRPYARRSLEGALRPIGLHSEDLLEWELTDLDPEDAEGLAAEALGPDFGEHTVRLLAQTTADCPLITVIGGSLIRRGQLDPGLLGHGDVIRAEILRAYRDALVADTDSGDSELRSAILDAVALLQPFHLEDQAFQQALAGLAGVPFDRTLRHLRSLEDGGVLLRRGSSLRVIPDLLGDVLLTEACVDDRSGIATGYIDRAFACADGAPVENMLVNASRIDWQVQQRAGERVELTNEIWGEVMVSLPSLGIRGRKSLLALLTRVAFFAPEQSLEVVRWLLNNPTAESEELEGIEGAILGFRPPSYEDVLHDIPPVLRSVAYNLGFLDQALTLLWELASTDGRPTNQYPHHALRVLQDLASFERAKPAEYNLGVVAAAERWLQGDTEQSLHSPFDVIEPMLATEGSDERATGLQIQFSPFSMNPEVVAPIRQRIVQLALGEIASASPKRAVRALECIEVGIRYPMGLFGREVSDEERGRWTGSFIDIIERLGQAVSAADVDPVVVIAAIQALQWHADYSELETQRVAESVRASLPMEVDHRLAIALYDTGNRLYRRRSLDFREADVLKEAELRKLATELLETYDDAALSALLEHRLQVQSDSFGEHAGAPGQLFWILVTGRPSLGVSLCQQILDRPDSVLLAVLPQTFAALADSSPNDAALLLSKLQASEFTAIKRCISQSLGWGRGSRTEMLGGEMAILEGLAIDEDEYVRRSVVRAAQRLVTTHQSEAVHLLSLVPFGDSAEVAEEVVQTFGDHGELSWNDIPAAVLERILGQLRECPSVEGHWSAEFLATLSADKPAKVVDLLTYRGELWELSTDARDFRPLPYQWSTPLRVRQHADYGKLLRRILEWTADAAGSWQRQETGGTLFMDVAADELDPTARSVLEDALSTGRSSDVTAVAAVLRKGPRLLAFDDVDFVRRLLRAASLLGEEAEQQVGGAICAAAISGSRVGTPGEPFAEDVFQLRSATEMADQMPTGSLDERLYRSLAASAQRNIDWSVDRDAAFDDRREW